MPQRVDGEPARNSFGFAQNIDRGKVTEMSAGLRDSLQRPEAGDAWQIAVHLAEMAQRSLETYAPVSLQSKRFSPEQYLNNFVLDWSHENATFTSALPRVGFLAINGKGGLKERVLGALIPFQLHNGANAVFFTPSAITESWLVERKQHLKLNTLTPDLVAKYVSLYRGFAVPEIAAQYQASCDRVASASPVTSSLMHLDPLASALLAAAQTNPNALGDFLPLVGSSPRATVASLMHTHALQPDSARRATNGELGTGLIGGFGAGSYIYAPSHGALAAQQYPGFQIIPETQPLSVLLTPDKKGSIVIPIDPSLAEQVSLALRAVGLGLWLDPQIVDNTLTFATKKNDTPIAEMVRSISPK